MILLFLYNFLSPVLVPLIYIIEALMTILFATQENYIFLSLRPGHQAKPCRWDLNEASPLDYLIISNSAVA